MTTRSKFFSQPFAFAGDVAAIPDALQPDGTVSFNQGWGGDYQLDQTTDPAAKPIDRAETNYLMNVMSAALRFWQTETFPEWASAADNNGVPVAYESGTIVRYRPTTGDPFVNYMSIVPNNTTTPGTAGSWINFTAAVSDTVKRSGDTMTGLLALFTGSTVPTPPITDNSTKIINSQWIRSVFASSPAAAGYIKLPGGLIMQWGTATLPVTNMTSSTVVAIFPLAFSAIPYFVSATSLALANTIGGGSHNVTMSVPGANLTTTQATLRGDTNDPTSGNGGNIQQLIPVRYFAIGAI